MAAIKAEIGQPLKNDPQKGRLTFLLESAYTGSTTSQSQEQALLTKQKMESLLENLFLSFIDRKELMVGE